MTSWLWVGRGGAVAKSRTAGLLFPSLLWKGCGTLVRNINKSYVHNIVILLVLESRKNGERMSRHIKVQVQLIIFSEYLIINPISLWLNNTIHYVFRTLWPMQPPGLCHSNLLVMVCPTIHWTFCWETVYLFSQATDKTQNQTTHRFKIYFVGRLLIKRLICHFESFGMWVWHNIKLSIFTFIRGPCFTKPKINTN